MLLDDTFDTKVALTALYLWLLFGFLSNMVSCDLQAWMKDDAAFRHFIGIVAFFFLFTILDQTNKRSVPFVWTKTLFVYAVFVVMTKSKWYFSLPVLLLLIADQTIRVHTEYLGKNDGKGVTPAASRIWNDVRNGLNVFMAVIVVCGGVHYVLRQRAEFGSEFSWSKFFLTSTCENNKKLRANGSQT